MSTYTIAKSIEDQNLVFGWANVSVRANGEQVVDFAKDMIDIEDLEQASYEFVLDYRDANVNHDGPVIGKLVECVCFTKEKMAAMGIPEGSIPEGMWLGFKVEPEVFAKVKNHELEMFSIEGSAVRVEVE